MARDADLNEIFMRAFILRRILLLSSGLGNVILMGSRHSAQTLRLREFLSRNGHPHHYVDLDVDKGAQDLLDRGEEAIAIGQHRAIELLAFLIVDAARLQGFQI